VVAVEKQQREGGSIAGMAKVETVLAMVCAHLPGGRTLISKHKP
jgi:hypothetical protein